MKFSKFKYNRLQRKLLKNIEVLPEARTVSKKEILSIGILTTDTILKKLDVQEVFEKTLTIKDSKLYSFRKFSKKDGFSNKHFSEKDINWKGEFIQPELKNFLEQPFDLLVGYFNTNHLYLENAILQSKATFKVGFSDINAKLYELQIQEKLENIDAFSSELKKYLTILEKLKIKL